VTIGASSMSGPMGTRNVSSTQAESACRQSTRHSQGWRKLLSAHIKQQWGIIFDFGFAPGHLARRLLYARHCRDIGNAAIRPC
jgi:hypothetical protein